MSWSFAFIAIRAGKDVVLQRLGMEDTGRAVEPYRAAASCVELPSGWTVVASDKMDFASPELLALLSQDGEALGCWLSDVVMASDAFGYRDGREVWSIRYDCNEHDGVVDAAGKLPPQFKAIYKKARAAQAAEEDGPPVDYVWDVPADVVAAITGYRYDEFDEAAFTVLAPPRGPKADPFQALKRLFGKR